MLRPVALSSAFILASLALLHCSSSDEAPATPTPAPAPDGGTSSGGSGGTSRGGTSSGGTSSGGTSSGDAGDAGDSFDHVGVVEIRESGQSETESAQFFDVPPRARCNVRQSGVCSISICPNVSASDPDAQSKKVDPGNVTITGGTAQPIVVTQAQGSVQLGSPWKIGETLSISSAGTAAVPAFTSSLVYPSNIEVTGPAPNVPAYTIPIDRASGVSFTWSATGPVSGDIAFTILQTQKNGLLTIECDFPQTAGAGLVPADALEDLETGHAEHDTAISASPNSKKVVPAGAYRVITVVTRFDPSYAVYGIVQ